MGAAAGKLCVAAVISAALFCNAALCREKTAPPVIRLAVSSFTESNPNNPIINYTIDELRNRLGDDRLRVTRLALDKLKEGLEKGEFDVMLTSAGFYRRNLSFGVRDLATLEGPPSFDPLRAESSVFIARSDREDIRGLPDLRGKTLSANMPSSFSGYQIGMGEIVRLSSDYEGFFGKTNFVGHRMAGVIEDVLSGRSDAGVLRTCFLEEYARDHPEFSLKEVKVLNLKGSEGGCSRSTELYPNWSFSATHAATPEQSRELLAIVLSMKPLPDGRCWTIATDFSSVDLLMKDLRIGPYEFLRSWSVWEFLREYRPLIVTLALVLLILATNGLVLSRLVKRRTAELERALSEQKRLRTETQATSERLYRMQKAGLVGQLSSLFVHELSQPLAAAKLYTGALLRKIERGRGPSVDELEEELGEIRSEVTRAEVIVDKVRGYAKGKPGLMKRVNVPDAMERAEAMMSHYSGLVQFSMHNEENLFVRGDQIEIELAIVNLLRNAFEAVKRVPKPRVEISAQSRDSQVEISVEDNGPRLSDDDFERLETPLMSTREEGLGLGVSIVRSIAERHHGSLRYMRGRTEGLRAVLTLPKEEEEELEK